MEILKPELVKAGVKPIGKILLGTVKGDLHDIGKNLVKMMAQGAGIEVVDCGIDVSADKFLQAFKDNPDAKAVGMSALLTTTMTGMKEVIDRFEKESLRKRIKFMVGGAPLTDQYAKEIGADGYAPDAASAADTFKAFLVVAQARARSWMPSCPTSGRCLGGRVRRGALCPRRPCPGAIPVYRTRTSHEDPRGEQQPRARSSCRRMPSPTRSIPASTARTSNTWGARSWADSSRNRGPRPRRTDAGSAWTCWTPSGTSGRRSCAGRAGASPIRTTGRTGSGRIARPSRTGCGADS